MFSGSLGSNAYSRALGEAANANHELKRYRVEIKRVRELALLALSLPDAEKLDSSKLNELEKHSQRMFDFYRREFSGDESDTTQEFRPLMETMGNLRLAAARIQMQLTNLQDTGPSLDQAITQYKAAWDVATYLDGLSNWPTFLREVRRQAGENQDLVASVPTLRETLQQLDAEWTARIRDALHGEMLLMASYQTPALAHLADVLIKDDIRPALQKIRSHHEGNWSTMSDPHADLAAGELRERLNALLLQSDEIDRMGAQWVESAESLVRLLSREVLDRNDLSETFVIEQGLGVNGAGKEKTAVFVVPHADDEASKLGALAAQLKMDGWKTVLIVMTDSSAGAPQDPIADTPELRHMFPHVRREELMNASRELGFSEVVVLGYGDSGMKNDPSAHHFRLSDQNIDIAAARLADVMDRYSPHAVFTIQDAERQFPYEHPDHEATERIARAATSSLRYRATRNYVPSYYVSTLALDAVQGRYDDLGLESLVGQMPEVSSPVTTAIQLSEQALAAEQAAHLAYSSQITSHPHALWRKTNPNTSYLQRVFPQFQERELEQTPMAGEKSQNSIGVVQATPSPSLSANSGMGIGLSTAQ